MNGSSSSVRSMESGELCGTSTSCDGGHELRHVRQIGLNDSRSALCKCKECMCRNGGSIVALCGMERLEAVVETVHRLDHHRTVASVNEVETSACVFGNDEVYELDSWDLRAADDDVVETLQDSRCSVEQTAGLVFSTRDDGDQSLSGSDGSTWVSTAASSIVTESLSSERTEPLEGLLEQGCKGGPPKDPTHHVVTSAMASKNVEIEMQPLLLADLDLGYDMSNVRSVLATVSTESARFIEETVGACLESLNTKFEDEELVTLAMDALYHFTTTHEQGGQVVSTAGDLDEGGLQTVMKVTKCFPNNETIQHHGCFILGDAAWIECRRALIAEHGGIDVVIRAMQCFTSNDAIQLFGCTALGALAYMNNQANSEKICQRGGVDLVLSLLRGSADIEAIVEQVSIALESLGSASTETRWRILSLGGVGLVRFAWRKYATPDSKLMIAKTVLPLRNRFIFDDGFFRERENTSILKMLAVDSDKEFAADEAIGTMGTHPVLSHFSGAAKVECVDCVENRQDSAITPTVPCKDTAAIKQQPDVSNAMSARRGSVCHSSCGSMQAATSRQRSGVSSGMSNSRSQSKRFGISQNPSATTGVLSSLSTDRVSALSVAERQAETYRLKEQELKEREKIERQQELATITEISTASAEAIKDIELKIKILEEYADDPAIVETTMDKLSDLTLTMENYSIIETAGDFEQSGIQILTTVITLHSRNEVIQRYGCLTLGNLAIKNDDYQTAIARDGGIESVVQAMKNFSRKELLQEDGCHALRSLARNNENNLLSIGRQGGIGCVVQAMRNFSDNEQLQQDGCLALGYLASNDDNRAAIVQQGGIALFVRAMTNFMNNGDLQHAACLALRHLASDDDNRVAIGRQGGIQSVVKAMKKFTNNEGLQNDGCLALGMLALNVANRSAIGRQEGGIESLVQAMAKFVNNEQLQRNGCLGLGNLAFRNHNNRGTIIESGWLELAVSAMQRFESNESLQSSGCGAVGNLASSEIKKKANVCLTLVVGAMKRFPSSNGVLRLGCFALESWASTCHESRSIIESLGGVLLARQSWKLLLSKEAKGQLYSELSTITKRFIFHDEFLSKHAT